MNKVKDKIQNILFWSVVAAVIIGSGTVTTFTKAGAVYQSDLLWVMVFSTFACLLFQEVIARITGGIVFLLSCIFYYCNSTRHFNSIYS